MGLTGDQWRFIAARLLTKTDLDAAVQVGIAAGTVTNWKAEEDGEFKREYEAAFADGVHVAKSYTRKLLGKAAKALDDALDAKDGRLIDHKSRLKAVELVFKTHGLLREKFEVTPDLSGLSDEDLLRLNGLLNRVSGGTGEVATGN